MASAGLLNGVSSASRNLPNLLTGSDRHSEGLSVHGKRGERGTLRGSDGDGPGTRVLGDVAEVTALLRERVEHLPDLRHVRALRRARRGGVKIPSLRKAQLSRVSE